MEKFIEAVRTEVKRQKMPMAELARRADTSRPYLYEVLKGQHVPTVQWVESICSVLGITWNFDKN